MAKAKRSSRKGLARKIAKGGGAASRSKRKSNKIPLVVVENRAAWALSELKKRGGTPRFHSKKEMKRLAKKERG